MRPEMPWLAAGGVSLIGSIARDKAFPHNAFPSVIATAGIVIVAAASRGTKVESLVRAVGVLALIAVVMRTAILTGGK